MTKLYSLLLLLGLLLARPAGAQSVPFPVDTLVKTGPLSQRINLVFLSDGYQPAQLPQFVSDVRNVVTGMFAQSPFREYQGYFNVFAVRVPSSDFGAQHPRTAADCSAMPRAIINTYFGSSFDVGGIHRLLVPARNSAIASVLATNFPLYDQAFVLVNTTEYGGAGGTVATSSINSNAREISIHEIGHSFADLADEYWAGPQYAAEGLNMTTQTNPALVRWAPWVGTGGAGVYPHAESPAWQRPHQNCKMRYLGVPFCPVCREAFVERIHALVPPVQGFSPAAAAVVDPTAAVPFALNLLAPAPNTLRVLWRRDGNLLARNTDRVTVPLAALSGGSHVVRAEVTDTTAFSRAASHFAQHTYVTEWTVTNTTTGTRLQAAAFDYRLETYPNPVVETLNLSYTLSRPAPVTVTVLDAAGRRLRTVLKQSTAATGTHEWHFSAAELGLRRPGSYVLVLDIDGTRVTRPLVKQ
ncbi:T9SS type A sorting domain-containing protein [Hymenobacter gummosus]|uniref:T9SS type A sorting domain-containing protein n=1 Tax=Hymenobacter gummosus TaxID=1776032 RepID=A0A431TX25_9BACT|nr:M64 family metallopeptidase [Hymenobacter gummosus]RTQ45991.1 T9SS type A sorting domain-containing protein [Hymenobacter gummosus]